MHDGMEGQCAVFLFLGDDWAWSTKSPCCLDAQGMASQPSLDDDLFTHESVASRHGGWKVDMRSLLPSLYPSMTICALQRLVLFLSLHGSSTLAYTLLRRMHGLDT